jgi:hypothetical protein
MSYENRAGLDAEVRGKISCPYWGSNLDCPVVQPVTRFQTRYTALYPGRLSS